MSFSPARPGVLVLLYNQQRNYTAQLGQNHESLSKLYKKLAKIEHVLSSAGQDRPTKRSCRKKWKWSQILTKRSITSLQDRQDTLYQHLSQCASLTESYHEQVLISPPTPWMYSNPSPCVLTPSSPFAFSPWAADFSVANSNQDSEATYWDLSRLREPSPFGSMADSVFFGPRSDPPETNEPSLAELDQIFSHMMLSPPEDDIRNSPLGATNNTQAMSRHDESSDPPLAFSPTKHGAQAHRRCVSAEVGQTMNGGLTLPSSSSKTGTSVGPSGEASWGSQGQ